LLDGLEVEVAQDHSEEGDDRGGEGAEIVTLFKAFCHFVILSFCHFVILSFCHLSFCHSG